MILPVGFQKVQNVDIEVKYLVPDNLCINESRKIAVELLDAFIF